MELKPGYKLTEMGAIPEDWKCVPAGEAIRFFGGNGFSSRAETTTGIRWLKIANVGVDKIKWDALSYLPDSFLKEYKDYSLKGNDVVMALTRPILNNKLKVARLTVEDEPAFLNQRVAKLIPINGNKLEYLFYVVQCSNFVAAMNLAMAGTDPPNIGNSALEKIAIAIPPKEEEQTAIANALSDANALIQSLTSLIAKKRQIKQGAMQTLLNPYEDGQLKEEWISLDFINIVEKYIDYRGRTPKKLGMEWWGGNILAVSANNVQMGKIDIEKEAYLGSAELYKKWMVQGDCERGDILLTMEAPLGNVAQIPDDKKYILSQRVILIKPKNGMNRNFLAHLMTGAYFQADLQKNASGSTAQGIQRKKLDLIPVVIPSNLGEQTRIAKILSDMDAEIAALEAKLAKYRHIKQGMMQNLLTGRIRLVQPGSNTGAVV